MGVDIDFYMCYNIIVNKTKEWYINEKIKFKRNRVY